MILPVESSEDSTGVAGRYSERDLGFGRDGSHAEFMAVPVEALVEIPPEFSDENAASIGVIYLAAFAAIVRIGEVKSGETVLATGTMGGVGSAAATLAHINGARVIGTVRSRGELAIRSDLSLWNGSI